MKIDWTSSVTEVLLNPKIPHEDRKRYQDVLLAEGGVKGHCWFATSGTTGKFKFVALSKEALLTSARSVNHHLNSDATDIWINLLPPFHVGGAGIFARCFESGAKVVNLYNQDQKWNPERFHAVAKETSATLTSMVPTQIYDCIKLSLRSPPTLRYVVVGGGGLDEELYGQARKLGWNVLPSYGLTECSSQVATASLGMHSSGIILEHVRAQVNKEGVVALKSPSLLTLYATIEDSEAKFWDPKQDGWFLTEDIGKLEGRTLQVLGRGSEFIKINGESISVPHLRQNLRKMIDRLGIKTDCHLSPIADPRSGRAIILYVEGCSSTTINRLVEAFNATVLPYEKIREVRYVDKILRNAMGKPIDPA